MTRVRKQAAAARQMLGRLSILAGIVLLGLPLGSYVYASWQQQLFLRKADDPRIVEGPSLTTTAAILLIGPEPQPPPLTATDSVSAAPAPANIPEPSRTTAPSFPANTSVQKQDRQSLMLLEIPALRLRQAVMADITLERLAKGPGHYPGSPLPTAGGNTAIAGHRTVRGIPSFFYRLNRLNPGDEIRLTYAGRSFLYEVESVFVVDPHDVWVLASTDESVLTLTTCDPPGTTNTRLIVRAKLVQPDRT